MFESEYSGEGLLPEAVRANLNEMWFLSVYFEFLRVGPVKEIYLHVHWREAAGVLPYVEDP